MQHKEQLSENMNIIFFFCVVNASMLLMSYKGSFILHKPSALLAFCLELWLSLAASMSHFLQTQPCCSWKNSVTCDKTMTRIPQTSGWPL